MRFLRVLPPIQYCLCSLEHRFHNAVFIIGEFERRGEQFDRILCEQIPFLGGILQVVYQHRLVGEQRNEPHHLVERHLEVLGFHELFAQIRKTAVSLGDLFCRFGGKDQFVILPPIAILRFFHQSLFATSDRSRERRS